MRIGASFPFPTHSLRRVKSTLRRVLRGYPGRTSPPIMEQGHEGTKNHDEDGGTGIPSAGPCCCKTTPCARAGCPNPRQKPRKAGGPMTPTSPVPGCRCSGGPPSLALRPREAARAIGVSERTLWSLARGGIVPSVCLAESAYTDRDGNRHTRRLLVFPVDALREWLAGKASAQAVGAPRAEADGKGEST